MLSMEGLLSFLPQAFELGDHSRCHGLTANGKQLCKRAAGRKPTWILSSCSLRFFSTFLTRSYRGLFLSRRFTWDRSQCRVLGMGTAAFNGAKRRMQAGCVAPCYVQCSNPPSSRRGRGRSIGRRLVLVLWFGRGTCAPVTTNGKPRQSRGQTAFVRIQDEPPDRLLLAPCWGFVLAPCPNLQILAARPFDPLNPPLPKHKASHCAANNVIET